MKGQWIGSYEGTVSGEIMLNIDDIGEVYKGVAYLTPNDKKLPRSAVFFETKGKNNRQDIEGLVYPIDPRTLDIVEWSDVQDLYSELVSHSTNAAINFNYEDDQLKINATTDINLEFQSVLNKPYSDKYSKIAGKVLSWAEFKSSISKYSDGKYIFRGQKERWKLRTSFHRRERYRLGEFTTKDVKQLHNKLSAITSHYFDLTVPEQNGSFFSLLQHHGYPTPLLDWSYSPYVAAFFAFRDWPIKYDGDDKARIFIFNNQEWQKKFQQIKNIEPTFPHFSFFEPSALANQRLVPQQAVTTATNIDDAEVYIQKKEKQTGCSFLEAIDIPASEREIAMKDLRFMGITAGSMFPGIDGVCEELREVNFQC